MIRRTFLTAALGPLVLAAACRAQSAGDVDRAFAACMAEDGGLPEGITRGQMCCITVPSDTYCLGSR